MFVMLGVMPVMSLSVLLWTRSFMNAWSWFVLRLPWITTPTICHVRWCLATRNSSILWTHVHNFCLTVHFLSHSRLSQSPKSKPNAESHVRLSVGSTCWPIKVECEVRIRQKRIDCHQIDMHIYTERKKGRKCTELWGLVLGIPIPDQFSRSRDSGLGDF